METKQLVELADQILAFAPDDDMQLSLIEAYTDAFAHWYDSAPAAALKAGGRAADAAPLMALSKKHAEVIQRVSTLMQRTSAKMGEFHKKAKGIMAYVDVFPKKISRSRPRRG